MDTKNTIVFLSSRPEISSRAILGFIKGKNLKFVQKVSKILQGNDIDLRAKEIYDNLEKVNARPVFYTDKEYPPLLLEIPDHPAVLYCRGNAKLLKAEKLLAVVGSRRASSYGLNQTKKIASRIASSGVVIVSGMALGIDGQAHRAVLEQKGETIAVLGTAIDQLYPAAHQGLGKSIIDSGSLVVSEFPPGFPYSKVNFPMRNRIIAGLCQATVVMEAAEHSGALITAYLAQDYNRDLFALPADADRFSGKGTNELIKKGAFCLTGHEDILQYFGLTEDKVKPKCDLSDQEGAVLEAIKLGCGDFDLLQTRVQLSTSELNFNLMQLELKHLIKSSGAGEYILN